MKTAIRISLLVDVLILIGLVVAAVFLEFAIASILVILLTGEIYAFSKLRLGSIGFITYILDFSAKS